MGWGGKRPGSGRPIGSKGEIQRKQHQIRATDEEWRKIQWFAKYIKRDRLKAEILVHNIQKELLNMENAIRELKEKVNDRYGIEANDRDITINTCRNGRDVAWWTFGDDANTEICIYVDTLEELDEEEIEEELACS